MTKLAIIGAGDFQLPLVKKAKLMGIETHCFAWSKGAVCKEVSDYFYPISILDKEHILKVCQRLKIDGITSIASDAAVITVCYVAEKMNLIGNAFEDALIMTNKYFMRERFLEVGAISPNYIIATTAFDQNILKFPVIVKPVDRSGSRGVKKVSNKSNIRQSIDEAIRQSFTKKAIIEEYIEGTEISVEAISWRGVHYILAITDKVTTQAPHFVEIAHHQPSLLSLRLQKKIKSRTIHLLDALKIKYGASHSEFKITKSGEIYIMEVGARMGGDFIGSDLVFLSTGYDYLKGVIEVALGKFHKPVISHSKFSGVYFLSEETRSLLPIIQKSNTLQDVVRSKITCEKLNPLKSSTDRSGYLLYQSNKKLVV